ncbi:uncharacterized protein AAEQ78_017510 [Lycaon pictus]
MSDVNSDKGQEEIKPDGLQETAKPIPKVAAPMYTPTGSSTPSTLARHDVPGKSNYYNSEEETQNEYNYSHWYGISSQKRSWPVWIVILIFLGVTAILEATILVHFLAVRKIFYYQGDFHISGVTYNDSCENGASQVSTDTSKNIETKMSDAFQNSSIYKEYINSQVIKILPDRNGSNVQLQLTFKFPPAKRNSMKTAIEAILYQILKDNMASWNAVPNSIRLIVDPSVLEGYQGRQLPVIAPLPQNTCHQLTTHEKLWKTNQQYHSRQLNCEWEECSGGGMAMARQHAMERSTQLCGISYQQLVAIIGSSLLC